MFKKLFFLVFFTSISLSSWGDEKVLIITSSYNRADFIEWQYKTFKKFLTDDYEFVVFNDAVKAPHKNQIRKMCAKYKIRCFDVPSEIHERPYLQRWPGESYHAPAVRNANVVQYALDTVGFKHNGIVAVFDSDLFLVRECSFNKLLEGIDILAVPQSRGTKERPIPYFWIGLCIMNMNTMSNKTTISFNCGRVHDISVDAGGFSHYYLMKEKPRTSYMNLWKVFLNERSTLEQLQTKSPLDAAQIELIMKGLPTGEFYHNGLFFHYRGGTNWDYKPKNFHDHKSDLVQRYIDRIVSETH